MDAGKAVFNSIDEYIAGFAPEIQELLRKVRATIREAAPEAKEKISYQMPTFEQQGNLVHFAAFKNHIGFYPGANGVASFQKELSAFKGAKGSVQFPFGQPIPFELIVRIVRFRVEDNKERAAAKANKRTKSQSLPE